MYKEENLLERIFARENFLWQKGSHTYQQALFIVLRPSGPPSTVFSQGGQGEGERLTHHSPKVVTRWQNACFHWMIQSNRVAPGK